MFFQWNIQIFWNVRIKVAWGILSCPHLRNTLTMLSSVRRSSINLSTRPCGPYAEPLVQHREETAVSDDCLHSLHCWIMEPQDHKWFGCSIEALSLVAPLSLREGSYHQHIPGTFCISYALLCCPSNRHQGGWSPPWRLGLVNLSPGVHIPQITHILSRIQNELLKTLFFDELPSEALSFIIFEFLKNIKDFFPLLSELKVLLSLVS